MRTFLSIFVLLSFAFNSSIHSIENTPPFLVLTVPKSGSFLICKFLKMLTGRKVLGILPSQEPLSGYYFIGDCANTYLNPNEFSLEITKAFQSSDTYPQYHFNFGPLVSYHLEKNPLWVPIIMIRDLRDACVSCVFMWQNEINKEINGNYLDPEIFDKQLMYVITMGHKIPKNTIHNIHRQAEEAILWYQKENVVVCRFENLIGKGGGGSDEVQKEQMIAIANALSISLDDAKLQNLTSNLFGTKKGPQMHSTFREGKIGSWEKYFKPDHRKAFNMHMGHLQTALGYSLE